MRYKKHYIFNKYKLTPTLGKPLHLLNESENLRIDENLLKIFSFKDVFKLACVLNELFRQIWEKVLSLS
jgi:hypothetical protein